MNGRKPPRPSAPPIEDVGPDGLVVCPICALVGLPAGRTTPKLAKRARLSLPKVPADTPTRPEGRRRRKK